MTQMNSSMNFLPEDYVEKRQAARAAVVFIGLLLAVVGGILGTWSYKQWQYGIVFEEQAKVSGEIESAGKLIAEAQQIDQERATMVAKAELTTTLMERVRRSALMKEFTDLQPKGVNMVSLELKAHEIAPQPGALQNSEAEKAKRAAAGLPPIADKPPEVEVVIDLVGNAPTDAQVAQYIAALGKSPLLTDVNLLFSEEFKRGKDDNTEMVRKFHVEMKVNPNADLRRLTSSDESSADASLAQ